MPTHSASVLDSWAFSAEPAFICNNKRVSKANVCARIASLARGINAIASVGNVVAVAGTNTEATLEVILAILAAGCICCPLNTRWSDRDVQHAVQLTTPTVLLLEPGLESVAKSTLAASPKIRIVPIVAGQGSQYASLKEIPQHALVSPTSQLIAKHRGAPLRLKQPECGTALICFTSGTTSAAKGVMISHAALVVQSLVKLAVVGYRRDDVYLHVAPLFHIGGISSALAVLMAGGTHVFFPKYSPRALVDTVQHHSITAMIAVPTMLQDICALPGATPCTSLQRLLVGAGTIDPGTIARTSRLLPNACIQSAYGMTEAASSITFDTLASPTRLHAPPQHPSAAQHSAAHDTGSPGSGGGGIEAPPAGAGVSHCVGFPAPGVRVRLLQLAGEESDGGDVARSGPPEGSVEPHAVGEVIVFGPQVTRGYWRDAQATAAALHDPPGWLRTGDLGWIDSRGRLHLCGRLKDMIKSGGENVHAAEVERALASVLGVTEAAVVAMPHARLGETVAALLCGAPSDFQVHTGRGAGAAAPVPLDAHDLGALQVALRAGGLAGFKVPRAVAVSARPLPRTAMGKVDKRAVRAVLDAAFGTQRSRL